jgi:hypothetical protein
VRGLDNPRLPPQNASVDHAVNKVNPVTTFIAALRGGIKYKRRGLMTSGDNKRGMAA